MPTKEQVLNNWYKRVSATQNANYQSAHHFALCSRWFGVPVISLSGFVGSSVFANLEKQPDIWYQIFVGFCSIDSGSCSRQPSDLFWIRRTS
jgi:hypothetical protein